MECRRINCAQEATMTLDLTVPLGDSGETFNQELPYCDNDLGWFYRSFARKSYKVTIRGITVIKDLDVVFNNLSK
jgi:hypothetical protein